MWWVSDRNLSRLSRKESWSLASAVERLRGVVAGKPAAGTWLGRCGKRCRRCGSSHDGWKFLCNAAAVSHWLSSQRVNTLELELNTSVGVLLVHKWILRGGYRVALTAYYKAGHHQPQPTTEQGTQDGKRGLTYDFNFQPLSSQRDGMLLPWR